MSDRPAILVLGNFDKPGVADCLRTVEPWLRERADLIGPFSHREVSIAQAAGAQLVIVFGGDGTLLSAARTLAGLALPTLGVNLGKLGFLAEFDVEHLQKHFDEIVAGHIQPIDRLMLEVCMLECGKPGCQGRQGNLLSPVANDVAISAGDPFRMIDLEVSQGGEKIARYLGDGLVVCTPTGSTGYNLSVGGPIVHPCLQVVGISPIAPHTLSLRPMMVTPDLPIRITATRVNSGTKVIVDGQVQHCLCEGHSVEVRRAANPLRTIPHPGRTYFGTMASKLKWGQSPHHTE